MKRITVLTALLLFIANIVFSQTTIVLQPDAETGKDAMIDSRLPNGFIGSGITQELNALAWTNSSTETIERGLIEFDLLSIPSGSIINSAFLTLYNDSTSSCFNGHHSSLSGSNQSVLKRIITNWNEDIVNWNNQPNTTTQNEVILAQSITPNQDYTNIDVTAIIQDMIDNPTSSFGFLLMLQTEQYYRCLLFASSDHPDYNRHPKLEITYTTNIGINDNKELLDLVEIYPNPTDDLLFIKFNQIKDKSVLVNIIDSQGKLVLNTQLESTIEAPFKIHLKNYPAGIYFIKIQGETFIKNKKVIVY